MFIDEGCRNHKVVIDGGELTSNINKRKKPEFYKPMDIHSITNAISEIISSISMWNIVNQLGISR